MLVQSRFMINIAVGEQHCCFHSNSLSIWVRQIIIECCDCIDARQLWAWFNYSEVVDPVIKCNWDLRHRSGRN